MYLQQTQHPKHWCLPHGLLVILLQPLLIPLTYIVSEDAGESSVNSMTVSDDRMYMAGSVQWIQLFVAVNYARQIWSWDVGSVYRCIGLFCGRTLCHLVITEMLLRGCQ